MLCTRILKRLFLVAFLTILPAGTYSREGLSADYWQDIYNALTDLDDFDEEGWAAAYDILTSMALAPQNLNTMTFDDLIAIPLLSEKQAMAVIDYRQMYGYFRSTEELALIPALDEARRSILKAVCHVPAELPAVPKDSLGHPGDTIYNKVRRQTRPPAAATTRHEILATVNIPTYERRGYGDGTYLGGPLSHSLRYRFRASNIQAAFTAANDAGEPFFCGTNSKGWDFYTGFVRLKPKGIVRDIVIGHYQMSMGMGLVMNTDYRLSRTSLLTTMPKALTTMRGHSSKSEYNYMQGIAAQCLLPLGKATRTLAATAFVSYRPLDATPAADSDNTIATILKTGYHRTVSETARRNSTRMLAAGGSVTFASNPFRLSLNVTYSHLRDSLSPDISQLYRWYMPKGKDFIASSLSYSYTTKRLQFAGETAVSNASSHYAGEKGGIAPATTNTLRYRLSRRWHAFALQRYYSYRYQTLTGSSLGDVSTCQNESGIYVGASSKAGNYVSFAGYIDLAYHPWLRYGYDGASRTFDTYLMLTYQKQDIAAVVRYRYREYAVSDNGSWMPQFAATLDGTAQHTLRFQIKNLNRRWRWMTQIHANYLPTSADYGIAAVQGAGYAGKKRSLWGSFAYFNTSDYAARVYITDKSLHYGSLFNMAYGKGIKGNVVGQADIMKNVTLGIQYTVTKYFDRDVISSGPQQITASWFSDIRCQIHIII